MLNSSSLCVYHYEIYKPTEVSLHHVASLHKQNNLHFEPVSHLLKLYGIQPIHHGTCLDVLCSFDLMLVWVESQGQADIIWGILMVWSLTR